VSSSVYATPLITDLYSDGRRDVVVPGFVHYMEVLQVTALGALAARLPAAFVDRCCWQRPRGCTSTRVCCAGRVGL
jgi:hypothetical protein